MLKYTYLFAIAMFLMACGASDQSEKNADEPDQSDVSKEDNLNTDASNDEPTSADKTLTITEASLAEFVPEGYKVHIWKAEDLTKDGLKDVLLVVAKERPNSTEDEGFGDEEKRPMMILQQKKGKLVERARNDNAILCSGCGGMMGDPFSEYSGNFAIKNGYFSIEQSGGSNWRWQTITTFKYDDKKDGWFLHKDGTRSWHSSDPEGKVEESVTTKKDFGVVKFADYSGPNN